MDGEEATKKELRASSSSKDPPPSIAALIDDVLERRAQKHHFFRPSMLHGCDRANVFHYRSAPFHPQRQEPRLQRILDNGTAIHEVIQGYLGDHPEWWFAREARIYEEVAGAWVRGSCDGVLIRRSDGYRVGVEIKTIAHAEFMKLTKPKPVHVMQASIYARLQKLHWIVILYWDKDKQHIKDFPVAYSREHWTATKNRIKYLKAYVDRGDLPAFNPEQCDPTFCQFVDHCAKKGGKPQLANRKW